MSEDVPVRRQRVSTRALIRRDGQVLLAHISPLAFAGSGAWTLPGGGVDHGEDPEACLLREVVEETGLEVTLGRILGVFSRHFTGRAPSGVLEDYHGIHLIFPASPVDPAAEPRVVEVAGTTDDARWFSVADIESGAVLVSEVVRYALGLGARA